MDATVTLGERAGGLLLHPTSLPGPHGVGDLGSEARAFVDFLAAAGQRWWQMLPVGPTDRRGSPYTSPSALAGSDLLLSLSDLAKDGLLPGRELRAAPKLPGGRVQFRRAGAFKAGYLDRAFAEFDAGRPPADFSGFRRRNAAWLEDYALYRALDEDFPKIPWNRWEAPLRRREEAALERARRRLAKRVRFHRFLQYLFARQWSALRAYAAARDVRLMGDIPIFVSHESADVWAHPEIFHLDAGGDPGVVAGVPPDYFSREGQRWGNPLYRWGVLRRRDYDWWVQRFQLMFDRFDSVRLDHFIGFYRAWAIPAQAKTAKKGRWMRGPRAHFFERVREILGPRELVAEDLGTMIPEVQKLRDDLDLPGMRVLQFAFDGNPDNDYLPHQHPRRCVVYTGTHDNDTVLGWLNDTGGPGSVRSRSQASGERRHVLNYLGNPSRELHWDLIRLAWSSVADTAIVPVQDVLGLGTRARMNTPGTTRGNWDWRLRPGSLGARHARRLRELSEIYGRLRSPAPRRRRTKS